MGRAQDALEAGLELCCLCCWCAVMLIPLLFQLLAVFLLLMFAFDEEGVSSHYF